MLWALISENRRDCPGSADAARGVVLLVVRVVVTPGALILEEGFEVDVAARIAERNEVVAVADADGSVGSVAVLGVVQGVTNRLSGDLVERIEYVLNPVALVVVAPAESVLGGVGPDRCPSRLGTGRGR